MMKDEIQRIIKDSINVKQIILEDENYLSIIEKMADLIIEAYRQNKKIILCGNGGSASDALHIEGELLGRFKLERKALPAIALTANTATITAIANDYDYDRIFQRQMEGIGNDGDVLIALTTSGNSSNIANVILQAKKQNVKVLSLLGKDGGKCKAISDIAFVVPSYDTARIQEAHIMIGHIICELVEKNYKLEKK